jgi:translation elongation factor EF-1alpha
MTAVGVVAAGKIHCGFVKPGMSVTFGPPDLKTKVSLKVTSISTKVTMFQR